MTATLHALPTADLATRVEVEARRDLMAEQAAENRQRRMMLAVRAFGTPRACVDCGHTFAIHELVNTGTGHDPIWHCRPCHRTGAGR